MPGQKSLRGRTTACGALWGGPLREGSKPLGMAFVDSHCHLNHDALRGGLDAVLQRAQEAHVSRLVVVGYDLESSVEALALAQGHDAIAAAVGLHPHDSVGYTEGVRRQLGDLARQVGVVAYGEIGLDYYYDNSPRPTQREVFGRQLEEVGRLGVPVIIHSRDAADDTRAILERHCPLPSGGVLHCYTYGVEELEWVLGLGLYIGLTGLVSFPKADRTREVAARVPLDRLLIETDAPYLAPVPHRGRTNEPAYLPEIAACIARARGVGVAEIEQATTRNAGALFGELVRV